jgi:copper chaperone for superoxide dismutase
LKQTLFAVPMTCDSCVKDISGALYKLQGITKVEANLAEQLVSIEGTGLSNVLS